LAELMGEDPRSASAGPVEPMKMEGSTRLIVVEMDTFLQTATFQWCFKDRSLGRFWSDTSDFEQVDCRADKASL